jgi:hypothetical protein
MPGVIRNRMSLRHLVGIVISGFVWMLYVTRVTLGIGPLHSHRGNQAPALHYLIAALVVTGMVAVWISVRRGDA